MECVASMTHRSGKRLSHAEPFSQNAADRCVQGIRSFKISEIQVIQHNSNEASPITREKGSLRSRLQAEAGGIFEKTGVSCQALCT
jgi:hypothetical protein